MDSSDPPRKPPKLVMQALGYASGKHCEIAGAYLEWVNINGHASKPLAGWTRDIKRAMVFNDLEQAFACWKLERTVVSNDPRDKAGGRTIPDGKPNRPLTAINVTFLPLE